MSAMSVGATQLRNNNCVVNTNSCRFKAYACELASTHTLKIAVATDSSNDDKSMTETRDARH